MLEPAEARKALKRLFQKRPVSDLEGLFEVLETRSRMSVFRRLTEVGYRTSFTHSGRFYTLVDVPRFDELGLWFSEDVGFSRRGTLKETVSALVDDAPAGHTRQELRSLLRVRVFNPLRDLLDEGRVERKRRGRIHLYLSPDTERAAKQLVRREELAVSPERPAPLPLALVLEVLLEAIRAGRLAIDAKVLATRLAAREIEVTPAQVVRICREYGIRLEKKTAE